MISPLSTGKIVKSISAFRRSGRSCPARELRRNLTGFLAIAIFAGLWLKVTPGVSADQDWEYWSKYSLEIATSQKTGFSLLPEFRFKDSFDDYYYFKTYLGLYRKLNKLVTLKAYYAYKTKKSEGVWKQSDLLYLDPTVKFSLLDMDFSTRFRFEYDLDKEELIYRTRLKLGKNLYKSMTFFVKEEPFYSFPSDRFTENRFSVGSSVRLWKKTRLSGECMLRAVRLSSGWQSANVLVSGLSFVF
ncbi:MAG: DUF2490 domain-containing protein [Planctomycetota bacterium]|jgi:hypothetical protein